MKIREIRGKKAVLYFLSIGIERKYLQEMEVFVRIRMLVAQKE